MGLVLENFPIANDGSVFCYSFLKFNITVLNVETIYFMQFTTVALFDASLAIGNNKLKGFIKQIYKVSKHHEQKLNISP